jgi:hypothetical protein
LRTHFPYPSNAGGRRWRFSPRRTPTNGPDFSLPWRPMESQARRRARWVLLTRLGGGGQGENGGKWGRVSLSCRSLVVCPRNYARNYHESERQGRRRILEDLGDHRCLPISKDRRYSITSQVQLLAPTFSGSGNWNLRSRGYRTGRPSSRRTVAVSVRPV